MQTKLLKTTEAVAEATMQLMQESRDVVLIGLNVGAKSGADGMTAGIRDKFSKRVFDMPVSEAAFTGMAVGSAIQGLRPIVHHGRVEFAIFAADSIITQASKWNYMFGGSNPVPIVFYIQVGRQWGNGPQHTQDLYGMWGSVTGLKVVIPSTPKMAKGLLISASRDNNPVVILQPRWLLKVKEEVPDSMYEVPLDKAQILKRGSDITVVTYGEGVIATLQAIKLLPKGISVEVLDLVSINPLDINTVLKSLKKTKNVLTVDMGTAGFAVGSVVLGEISKRINEKIKINSIGTPHVPCPTSSALDEKYYPTNVDVANAILKSLGKKPIKQDLSFDEIHMAPSSTIIH
jgi:pyruvate dehydrogenase E1 component beta subunit